MIGYKRRARAIVDRAVRPYIEEIVDRLRGSSVGTEPHAESSTESDFILHNALHMSRTLALSEMPAGTKTMLSAGPNGSWYFDWIEDSYGTVDQHIAVEAYTSRPTELPDNVEWIEADIAAPNGVPAVEDEMIDLVFSGQNIEHLWPDQVVSFLVESNRVLKPGGWLVVDSPNREITASYRWSMSEHTLEFSPDEAETLLQLGGFEVRTMKGLWLCRRKGRLLPLDPDPSMLSMNNLERIALSANHPADSFIWWIEATKVGPPNREALREEVLRVYAANWGERISRLVPHNLGKLNSQGNAVVISKGTEGYFVIGPYMPLPPGSYVFRIRIQWSDCDSGDTPVGQVDVIANDTCVGSTTILPTQLPSGSTVVDCEVTTESLAFTTHVRVFSNGNANLEVPVDLTIDPPPWRVATTA